MPARSSRLAVPRSGHGQEELFGLEDDGLEDEDEDEAPGGGATGGARAGDRVDGDARPGGRDEPPQEQADDQASPCSLG